MIVLFFWVFGKWPAPLCFTSSPSSTQHPREPPKAGTSQGKGKIWAFLCTSRCEELVVSTGLAELNLDDHLSGPSNF